MSRVVVVKSVWMKSVIDALYNRRSWLIFCWASNAPTSGSAIVEGREKSRVIGKSSLVSETANASVGPLRGEEGTEHAYEEEHRSKIGMKRKG